MRAAQAAHGVLRFDQERGKTQARKPNGARGTRWTRTDEDDIGLACGVRAARCLRRDGTTIAPSLPPWCLLHA